MMAEDPYDVRIWVCPKCGRDTDDMEELEVIGLTRTSVFKCPCGALVSDDGLVTSKDFAADR